MNKYIKVLKLTPSKEGRLTVGKKYKCLDNSRHTAIIDDNEELMFITLGAIFDDEYEVIR